VNTASAILWIYVFITGPGAGRQVGPFEESACRWLSDTIQRDRGRGYGQCVPVAKGVKQ
jgi:hypothetical protein